jgi:hypothetical protein
MICGGIAVPSAALNVSPFSGFGFSAAGHFSVWRQHNYNILKRFHRMPSPKQATQQTRCDSIIYSITNSIRKRIADILSQ